MTAVLAGVAMVSLMGAFGMVIARIGTDPFADRNRHDSPKGDRPFDKVALGRPG